MTKLWAANTEGHSAVGRAVCTAVLLQLIIVAFSIAAQGQGPALTTIEDTVYRADGSGAAGTIVISWPSFQTAEGDAVAAGNLSVILGTSGAFTAQLVPNVGATPAGTFYVAVFQLDDGTVRKEYWAVPTTSPTTITAILTTPGNGLGNQAVTESYVNGQVANRALDATVVHLAGSETITGVKQFAAAPSLPSPVTATDGANKSYVDAAVANVGAGSFVAKAGDTMSGPLNLPGDPTSPNQAADRHYVDSSLASKADIVSGTVPTVELGAGVASSATCLTGNSTWGLCGGGAPAGITYATTGLNWSRTIATSLTGGAQAVVVLTPCPVGIDTTSGAGYEVLLTGGGNSEAAAVTSVAGGCVSGGASGSITLTPLFSYPAGYSISSASSGIQETLNAGCGVSATTYNNSQCNAILPANGPASSINTYNVYGTIYMHSNQSVLSGYGVSLNCLGRGACLQVGDLLNSNNYTNNTITGLSFRTPVNVASNAAFGGVAISQTQRTSQVVTVTTASAHGFRVGDMVTIMFTDSSTYWGDAVVTAVPGATTFQYAHAGADLAVQATPGVVALAYVAVLDNAMNTHLVDISYDKVGENGHFNNFFDLWDDENATISHFNNNAINVNWGANWTGSFVFSAGNQAQQIAPVITLRDSTITANYSNGVTVYNSNGLYIENTVLQATGPWQVYSSNTTGNYQGAYLKNIYSESSAASNPLSPARSPFPGLGVAGLIAGASSTTASFQVAGNGGMFGAFAGGGTGTTPYSYFIVVNDATAGTQSSPMQVMNWLSTGSDAIAVRWPRVANGTDTITYDVIRMTTPLQVGAVYPYAGGCLGGTGGACGYIAKGLTQSAACAGGLVCTYSDAGSATTSNYSIKQGTYVGHLAFWPGSIVTVNKSVSVDWEEGAVVGVGLAGTPLQIAPECSNYGQTSPGGYTACTTSVTLVGNSVPNQTATIMADGASNTGGNQILTKGRLNFGTTAYTTMQPHHIITLIDSQPALTQATTGYRPAANSNDVWIGTDVTSGGVGLSLGQLAFGAPVAITNYIGATGDGIHNNWVERLTASLREFNIPVKFDQSVTLSGLTNGCLNVVSGMISSTGIACGSGGGGGGVTSVFGRSGSIVAASGDYTVAQVTGAATDSAVVHNSGTEVIGGAKTFTTSITASGNLILPQGAAFIPTVGGVGLDTSAGLPVINIGGSTNQIALTSSNISGQAGTALALAATPTQCSGAFATGIAANGNANCTTPNVIQLSETTQPAGIPNWGVFWFDSATHSPRFIENNGQVTQVGLTNLFNSDPGGDPADNLEQRNGITGQNLRVYSTFVNNTTWQRASLGFDTTDNYAVLRSENATSASAPGLGFWIGSGLKWVVDASGNLKPWTDNTLNVGSDSGNAVKSIFAKTSFNSVVFGRNDFEIPNDASTGTIANELAVFNATSPSQAVVATTSATSGVIGIVQGNAGKTGNAIVTWRGYAYCVFDSVTTAGDTVIASTTGAGKCHDTGSSAQPAVQLIGYADVTNAVSGQTNAMRIALETGQSGGGSVASVFGRTGTVVAASGDYSAAQVTGAAVDSTVVHLAGTESITGVKTFTSNLTLSGNLSVAGTINQTGSGPTQWSGQPWAGTTVTVPSGLAFSLGVGSDNVFRCQLTSGASCMPTPTCSWITMPTQSGSGNAFSGTSKAIVWGVYNPYPCITNNVAYVVGTADNTANNYALGLYSGGPGGSGTLIASTASAAGTAFVASTGIKHAAWNTTNITVPAGRVYIALTSNCASTCAALLGSSGSGVTWAANIQVAVTTGGATLPSTVTLPADSFSSGASIPSLVVY